MHPRKIPAISQPAQELFARELIVAKNQTAIYREAFLQERRRGDDLALQNAELRLELQARVDAARAAASTPPSANPSEAPTSPDDAAAPSSES